MPDLNIKIGGHDFQMACSPGEEAALEAAANLLDQEAKDLNSNNQKLPESKMSNYMRFSIQPNKPASPGLYSHFHRLFGKIDHSLPVEQDKFIRS